jgi:benzodiazapine receptor
MNMTRTPLTRTVQTIGLVFWLLLTFVAATAGAFASASAGSFYSALIRPDWAPPPWLFAPVWTSLYLLMGIAAWLVWRAHGVRGARWALTLYVVQLIANALWTWLFFVWENGALSFIEIVLLWGLIVATMLAFWRRQRVAALLLLPYLAWVSFASVLSYTIWQLNPTILG